jgi:hypothetical protein
MIDREDTNHWDDEQHVFHYALDIIDHYIIMDPFCGCGGLSIGAVAHG